MASTGELLAVTQSSVFLPQYRSRVLIQRHNCFPCYKVCATASTNSARVFALKATPEIFLSRSISFKQQSKNRFSSVIRGTVVPEKVPTGFSVDLTEGTAAKLDNSGGGGGGEGNSWGGSGGGGGEEGEGASGDSEKEPKKTGMSMSQKLTLGYAVLVGLGGLMGYLKSGSQKSLISGGISAALLFFVYTQLPMNPVFASCIGLGLSAALMGVIGLRFKKSGKVFPAGVVSLVSLIMTGGYIHGVMRSFH